MSDARQQILDRARQFAQTSPDPGLPGSAEWSSTARRFENPREQLRAVLESAGGRLVVVKDLSEARKWLEGETAWREAACTLSLVKGLGETRGEPGPERWQRPHDFALLDVTILASSFAVAENGAAWLNERLLPHRVVPFITQHLILVQPASEIVHHMPGAYERLGTAEVPRGVFISGPSKTADIEQSLVIGAHGARSHTLLLLEHVGDAPKA
jgi:L-lactate dehydrogenase complex protein LldG